jgi:protoheme ferro-lyase
MKNILKNTKTSTFLIIATIFLSSQLILPNTLSTSIAPQLNDSVFHLDEQKIGILIINYGEPTTFTQDTFSDFKAYMTHMLDVGMLPSFLKNIDKGTILTDTNNDQWTPFFQRNLVNAWGETTMPVALYAKGNEKMHTVPHYFLPFFGPGFGEADVYEQATLTAYHSWRNMNNYSPYKDHTMPQINNVIDQLELEYGDRISCTSAFGFEHGDVSTETNELLNQNIDALIVTPQMVVDSDFEGTLHWYKDVYETIDEATIDIPVVIGEQIGSQPSFVESIVRKVKEELNQLSSDARVSLFLSNHGFPPVKIGSFDAGSDSYHDNADHVFQLVKKAIIENISTEKLVEIKQIYAEFAEGDNDPENIVFSPMEALNTLPSNCNYVIDIPYGFIGETTDTLNALRDAFGVEGWDENYETIFTYEEKVTVKITSCYFHNHLREQALYESINNELNRFFP